MYRDDRCEIQVDGDGQAIINVPQELDVIASRDVYDDVTATINDNTVERLVFDLSRTDFMDATGLGTMLDLHNQSQEADKPFRLINPRPAITKILEMTGLTSVFIIEK